MAEKVPTKHSLNIDSTPSAIETVCSKILPELKTNSFSEEDIFSVHLALHEVFINAVRHGNKMAARKKVRIDYSINSAKAEIIVTDQGNGFDPSKIPDPRCGDNIYKTEGRGLLLIRAYMDVVEFNEKGNCVHMIKFKKSGKPKESIGISH